MKAPLELTNEEATALLWAIGRRLEKLAQRAAKHNQAGLPEMAAPVEKQRNYLLAARAKILAAAT